MKEAVKGFFYSPSLGAYVATQPLKVDDRVVKAASECGINLSWDDEGRVNNITFIEAKKLAKTLGAFMLTPRELWMVYGDAINEGQQDVLEQLLSDQFIEWLDVAFIQDERGVVQMIEHPVIIQTEEGVKCLGKKQEISIPYGRPGWFNPKNNIEMSTGLPISVSLKRERGTAEWSSSTLKYWSVFKFNELVAAIRGYVTSSGTPSLDLDIPFGANEAVLMLRECRHELVAPAIDPDLMSKASEFIDAYLATTVNRPAVHNPKDHAKFYDIREELFAFLNKSGRIIVNSRDEEANKVAEKIVDMLGIMRVMAKAKNQSAVMEEVNAIAKNLFGECQKQVCYESFVAFVKTSKERLQAALMAKSRIIFVMGHKNPDTDTAVSCLAEAFRNSLIDKTAAYVPVIQGSRIPDEIRYLLGDEISDSILLTSEQEYDTAMNSGQARWILVDQNVSEVQRFTVSIVDHHLLSEKAKRQDISKTWEMAGSTTALVTQKLHGMGVNICQRLARILYGATLMDTENRSERKMTFKDHLIMDDLKETSRVKNDFEFYKDLMSYLLNTDDAELLFARDYKQDWGIFGFAVAKVKGAFSKTGEVIKKDLLDRLVSLAQNNNKSKNFPLTIVKVADYLDDNQTVNKERIYLIFNDHVLPEFKQIMFEFVRRIITNEFKDRAKITVTENSVDFWGVGDQLSRKVTAPFFEPIVQAFNEYYYSPSTGLYVKREFMKADEKVKRTAATLGLELSVDKQGRLNNITFNEAKILLEKLGLSMLSLSEYWQVLKEAGEIHDEQMLKHLREPNFVELLDTLIIDGQYIINHPEFLQGDGQHIMNHPGFLQFNGFTVYSGEKRKISIPEGVPGLIDPDDIDLEIGFPKIVQDPRQYGNPKLWRYWSPDAPLCIATRGHIFLLGKSALDTKIHPDDALPNLGVRPCCRIVEPPKIEIAEDENGVYAKIA